MPRPRSVPEAPLGKIEQQPLLSARVNETGKLGRLPEEGGAQLGSAERGVPWQAWLPPLSLTHPHHRAPGADGLGSRGQVVIPTQPLPERAPRRHGGMA